MTTRSEGVLTLDNVLLEQQGEATQAFACFTEERLLQSEKAVPFVKWAGGKRSIIDKLVSRLPAEFNQYWEPFVGGGAFFFEIQPHLSSAFLSDSNFELMVTYNAVKKEPLGLIAKLERHSRRHSKQYYYQVRKRHKMQDPIDMAARFLYLNKTCYNGLFRVNKKGEFNVPIGSYVNPDIVQRENILACSAAIASTPLEYREFDTIKPNAGDFVYCDPPYNPVNSTSFTKYTSLEFGELEQERLQNFALKLHRQGVMVMLSNSDTALIRELYRGAPWHVVTVQAPRNVNSNPDGRGVINELIITNYSV